MIDEVLIIDESLENIIIKIKPDLILKGNEHRSMHNVEDSLCREYGGKLIFGSGDFTLNSDDYLDINSKKISLNISKLENFVERQSIKRDEVSRLISNFNNLKVLVIGDLIIDEYIDCETIGLSQEDPVVVFRKQSTRQYVGGAGIVALHSASAGARTSFLTFSGSDVQAKYARQEVEKAGIKATFIVDSSSNTVLKQRFRVNGKTHFRLSHFDDTAVDLALRENFVQEAKKQMLDKDLIILSDFNYGVLDKETVEIIITEARKNKIFIAADCQISSQISDYLKYKGVDFATPTEHEARVTLRDNSSGLATIAQKFQELLSTPNIFITLGSDGVLVQKMLSNQQSYATDSIPALANYVKDVAGAGDSMLVYASLSLASGYDVFTAAYLASIAAGVQVSRVGNTPISTTEITTEIK